ncbi:MAG: UDP-N-acetylmuramoyl-tripeptide--D-alanyl-D-alanine ligase [Planctomycetes bacterium]|nr:UDP-N-acetylmuramoyl-tripeptide--D-alanyl-D-alanine ligase [Planctomycetota bacterium]
MFPHTLDEICRALEVPGPRGLGEVRVTGVSIDSRTCRAGDCFVGLRGTRADGAEFCAQAAARGAVAAVVAEGSRVPEGAPDALLRVADPLAAIALLARLNRDRIGAPVIAVTGSNGKTTTKDMVAHLLAKKFTVAAAARSFNNSLGVPLTLLQTGPQHAFVVLEIGTNHPGEIAPLAALARPEVAVVTNVSESHLAGLGTVEGVAAEKETLLASLQPKGVAVLNADNRYTREMKPPRGCRRITFGSAPPADCFGADLRTSAEQISFRLNGEIPVSIPILGACNLYNALAAIAVAVALGRSAAEAAEALRDFRAPPMRMQVTRLRGATIVNDAYNSNPKSALYALDEFEHLTTYGRKIVVFGDMLELGPASRALHEGIADRLATMDLYAIVLVGAECRAIADRFRTRRPRAGKVVTAGSSAEAGRILRETMKEGDLVLLKGSRGVALERVFEAFDEPGK